MLFRIDPLHSLVEFSILHLKISLVKGRFNDVSGSVVLDPQHLEKSSVNAQVAVESISTGAPKRDAHLRSADFFDAARYPTITFKSTQVKLVDQTHCWLSGELTLHGVTRMVTFQVTYTGTNKDPLTDAWRVGLFATTQIDRRDFSMNFQPKIAEGIAVVGNETRIEIHIEAIQVPD